MKNFKTETFAETDTKIKELKQMGYHELDVPCGTNAEQFAKDFVEAANSPTFKKFHPLFFSNFNGCFVFNDDIENLNVDSIYKHIVGRSIEEQKNYEQQWVEDYHRREEEFKNKIPTLAEQYIEKGHKVIDEQYWKLWDETVPKRLADLYHGMELDCTIELIEMLNNKVPFNEVYAKLENQGHSAMSFYLMKCMLFNFGGKEFVDYIDSREK